MRNVERNGCGGAEEKDRMCRPQTLGGREQKTEMETDELRRKVQGNKVMQTEKEKRGG